MLGELTAGEIDGVLRRGRMGRLSVAGDEQIYIFPISYGYDGRCIYPVSQLGLKVKLMRKRPEVCFEVEEIESLARWRTVMVHGTSEEVWDAASREHAFCQIAAQGGVAPLNLAPYTGRPELMIVYQIEMREATGRFEHDEVIHGAHRWA